MHLRKGSTGHLLKSVNGHLALDCEDDGACACTRMIGTVYADAPRATPVFDHYGSLIGFTPTPTPTDPSPPPRRFTCSDNYSSSNFFGTSCKDDGLFYVPPAAKSGYENNVVIISEAQYASFAGVGFIVTTTYKKDGVPSQDVSFIASFVGYEHLSMPTAVYTADDRSRYSDIRMTIDYYILDPGKFKADAPLSIRCPGASWYYAIGWLPDNGPSFYDYITAHPGDAILIDVSTSLWDVAGYHSSVHVSVWASYNDGSYGYIYDRCFAPGERDRERLVVPENVHEVVVSAVPSLACNPYATNVGSFDAQISVPAGWHWAHVVRLA